MRFKDFLNESVTQDIRTLSAHAIELAKKNDMLAVNVLADYIEENCRNQTKADILRQFASIGPKKPLLQALKSGVKNGFIGFGGTYNNTLGTFIKIRIRMPYISVIKNPIPDEAHAYFEIRAYAPVVENVMQDLMSSQKCFLKWTDEIDLARYVSLDPKNIVLEMERLPGYFGRPTMIGPALILQSWFDRGLLQQNNFKKSNIGKQTYTLIEPDNSVHEMHKEDLSPSFWNTIILSLSSPTGTLIVANDLESLDELNHYANEY
jgi:hypothetical protein